MNRKLSLLAILLAAAMMSSCISQNPGIFGNLPEIYRHVAEQRRDVDELLADGTATDDEAAAAARGYTASLDAMQKLLQKEAKALKGHSIPLSTSRDCGYSASSAVIEEVTPGLVTKVLIRIPVKANAERTDDRQAYLTFLDADGLPVAKSIAWYDPDAKAVRLEVPFALIEEEKAVSPEAFDHYEQTMSLRLVGYKEYNSDNVEQPSSTLLKLEGSPLMHGDSATMDSAENALLSDSTATDDPEAEAWNGPLLDAKGVGHIRLGAALTALPDHDEGVYDHKHLEKQFDEMEEEPMLTASFRLNGKTVATALGDEQGNIIFITIETPDIKVEIDGHYFGVGDPIPDLLKMKGVKPDESGAFAATYHGISFTPTPSGAIHSISVGAVW